MNRRALFVGNFLSASGTHRLYVEDLTDRLETMGWTVFRTSAKRPKLARLADMLHACWAQRASYDVGFVDVFSGSAFVWAELVTSLLQRLGKPYVLTLRGGQLPAFARRWPGRVRRLLSSAALVSAPSRFLATELAEYGNAIEVVPNAVDVALYRERQTEVMPRLIWLRAFHAVYNPLLAIEVLAELRRRGRDATLTMIGANKGDGSWESVHNAAAKLGVTNQVTFVAGIPKREVPAALSRADIFLNTTNVDNAPVSVLEALASGLPVISTDVGGIPYLLTNRMDALLVPPRDHGAMTSAVENVLDDPELAGALVREGRATAIRHSWENVLARWNDVYDRGVSDA